MDQPTIAVEIESPVSHEEVGTWNDVNVLDQETTQRRVVSKGKTAGLKKTSQQNKKH